MIEIIGDKTRSRFDPGLAREINKKVENQERQERLKQKILNEETKEQLEEKVKPQKPGKKPKIKLIPLENLAVNTQTHEEYDTLMQVYMCGGWKQFSGNGIVENYWDIFRERTNVHANQDLYQGLDFSHFESNNFIIITPQKFYDIQHITSEILKEIGDYFKNQEKK